jgi:molybdopterin converting factor small subunit
MEVVFEFYGGLRRLAGVGERTLRLGPDAATVADALAALERADPALAASLAQTAVAIGDALVRRGDRVASGARLALLPPVAGG